MTEFLAWKRSAEGDRHFGKPDPAVERFQRPWPATASYELVETSYFGFCIPEEDLNCEIYHCIRPKFSIASGGVLIFKGHKTSQVDIDFLDWRNYMPMPDDLTDCTYPNGVRVKMIKPLEEFEIAFDDPKSDTRLRLHSKAIMPAAFRPVGGHLTQAMKNSGTLRLRGRDYRIDSYFSRDRSWGDARTESKQDIPAAGWHVGVFDDDFAFHVTAFDSPEHTPALASRYGLEGGKNLLWGYVWKGGKLLGVKSCTKITRRKADGLTPAAIELKLTDQNDETYEITGEIRAHYPFAPWPNITAIWCITRWHHNGRVGYGDTQDSVYENYVRDNLRR